MLSRLAEKRPGGRVFLFHGPRGGFKQRAAVGLASAWLCLNGPAPDPCGECPSCQKLGAGQHPDLLILKPAPDREKIGIDPARELKAGLRFAPVEGPTRVVLIPQAEKVSPEAGNALLKTLEEPPLDTLILLTSDQAETLLPTILSRCLKLRFPPLAEELVIQTTAERLAVDPETARLACSLAGNEPDEAAEAISEQALKTRQRIIELLAGTEPPDLIRLLELAQAESGSADRARLFLDLCAVCFRDILYYSSSKNGAGVYNRDILLQIAALAERTPSQESAARLEAVLATQTALQAHANPRLALEALVLKISSGPQGAEGIH